ncbi:MAG: DUF362 domain-containing protein [Deltaproteobacteria bacterium]|jgi:uncharacterized Fe-S center protein|nr:DUF362 domain-containing protein [Deltaproteobacteria bacterium]
MSQKEQAASPVYFAGLRAKNEGESKVKKIERLFSTAGFDKMFGQNDLCAVKMHFGERGNDAFVHPVFVRAVVRLLKNAGARPFLTDTNTLYRGQRHNAVEHTLLALEHGFSYATVEAPVIIADGLRGHCFTEMPVQLKHFSKVSLADAVVQADGMLALSHFKGHVLSGFGGALKNLAMGCAPARGKKDQHQAHFLIDPGKCVACGQCLAHCPENSIAWSKTPEGKRASITQESCIGCGECMTMCKHGAINLDFASERTAFTERMIEYAYGASRMHPGKTAYMNFLLNITPDCDCAPWSDAPLVPDIGILAASDPVALDKACFDLVNAQPGFADSQLRCNHGAGEDKFKGSYAKTIGEVQFQYAESIGLGNIAYELVKI